MEKFRVLVTMKAVDVGKLDQIALDELTSRNAIINRAVMELLAKYTKS